MSTDPITITRLTAENVLKFEHFDLHNIEKLTVFRGANNQGKTTALRLLGLAVRGADDPAHVIHDGAKKATVSLGLSNGYTLRRSFTEKGQYFDLLDDRGHKVPSPQSYINNWLGEYRDFNPLAWLDMEPKEQIRILLQAIDVRLSPEEFRQATGLDAPPDVDFNGHGLMVLDTLRAYYAEERKICNRLADQKRKAAAEARAALPAERPTISDERRAEASRVKTRAQQTRESIEARKAAATSHTTAVDGLEKAKTRELDGIAEDDREITRLEAEIVRVRMRRQDRQNRIAEIESQKMALASSAPPTQEELDEANALIGHANLLAKSIATDEQVVARFVDVDRLEQETVDAASQASTIDQTIKVLDGDVRTALMAKASLPVDSLTVSDGQILVGGHELQYLAESQRIRIAVAIARALRPALRVIVLDGAEQLDTATFALFLEEIRGDGFTYLASEVDRNGGSLEVIVFGETENGVVQLQEVA